MLNRAAIIDQNFGKLCEELAARGDLPPRRDLHEQAIGGPPDLTGQVLYDLFESQIISRHLDLMARELRKQERGFYTIGSSGHEGNAVLGRLVRKTDPAFLHYRSGALMIERARQVPGYNEIRDCLLGMMASGNDPTAGGRHKVWGSAKLCVIPQTSTIASHLPRAMGAALALKRGSRLHRPAIVGAYGEIPEDSVILCNFGEAGANHSVAAGAMNAVCFAAHQNLPMPILLVCEDNGLGISVHSPPHWIEAAYGRRDGLRYSRADGLDLVDMYRATEEAAAYVRRTRRPAFLHVKCVRLMGHAGTDVETEYHSVAQIAATEANDPLLASARIMVRQGYMSPREISDLYENVRRRIADEVAALGEQPQLSSPQQIIEPLAPCTPDKVQAEAARVADDSERLRAFELPGIPGFARGDTSRRLPEQQEPRHMAALINWALHDMLAKYPEALVFGEDVAAKGGVYHVTSGLSARFGVGRVFNTLLDETSILGMAIGAAHMGLLPIPEIQYLAYVHNAIDQLRGEACSTQFFSNRQFANPMVVRIASLGYQKGFGGHFHNDNSIAALRDIPGLLIALPSRGDDAVRMLRTCMALAKVDGRVAAFLEPIALYMTKDLYEDNDGLWRCEYPAPDQAIPIGEGRVYDQDAGDLTILTYGNGVPISLRAARILAEQHNVRARVVDLRWLNPLNEQFILEQSRATGRVLVVDEGRYTGGISEALLALLMEHAGGEVKARRIVGWDTYMPLGPAANLVLPSEASVIEAAVSFALRRKRALRATSA